MSETVEQEHTGEQQADDTTSSESAGGTGESGPDPAAEAEKWKALARKHEARAKENADKAKQFDELTEKQKSEQQKLQEKADKAEKAAAEAQQAQWRAEIAAEKGLTLKQANRLVGTSREELAADADELLTDFGSQRQVQDFGGGDRGSDVSGGVRQWTRSDLEGKSPDEIEQARKDGHLDRLMGKTS